MNPLTRLSNHVYPPTIRSSAALGDIHPTQRTFDRNSTGCGACVHIGHGNAERFEGWCPPPSSTNGAARKSTGRWCTGVSTNPPSRRYSEHTRQRSSRFLCLPALRSSRAAHSVARCKGPHASVILRNRPPPVSLWFQHGLETDLITFFRLHPVEPAALQSREFAHFLSDPCRAGDIGRDDLIEPQLQRNLTPRTRTTRSIKGEIG
jgi:hypothetical protein